MWRGLGSRGFRLANGATAMEGIMSEMRTVKDLAIGDVIQVDGFDGNLTVRSAKKIKKGLDAGKLQVMLATPDGEKEVMGFDPEERVKVVGKDAEGGKGQSGGKGRAAGGKGTAKGKAKAKREPDSTAAAAPTPEHEGRKKAARQKKAAGEEKLSAIDAAAKVLADSGAAMNCQDLIKVMAEKNLWTSPGGKTPSATLYSAILRELQTKGSEARFKKTERGKFSAANGK
jgi:hypothetical protein